MRGWAIEITLGRMKPWFLAHFFHSRREAIAWWNSKAGRPDIKWAQERRRGRVRAVKVEMREIP